MKFFENSITTQQKSILTKKAFTRLYSIILDFIAMIMVSKIKNFRKHLIGNLRSVLSASKND